MFVRCFRIIVYIWSYRWTFDRLPRLLYKILIWVDNHFCVSWPTHTCWRSSSVQCEYLTSPVLPNFWIAFCKMIVKLVFVFVSRSSRLSYCSCLDYGTFCMGTTISTFPINQMYMIYQIRLIKVAPNVRFPEWKYC